MFKVKVKVQKGEKEKEACDPIESEKGQDKTKREEQNKGDINTLDNCKSNENAKIHQEKPRVKVWSFLVCSVKISFKLRQHVDLTSCDLFKYNGNFEKENNKINYNLQDQY
ncbi:Hypothetical predicted protein [Octopus vulgaris]|uniref:Uncharacterized protein n=1 Tax=Octopus vulgaris TaxID=6645 RepID=A0AA36FDY6_OCTVU|nr:Hypothetical predicted protein [Octopus vulgaris]